RRDVADVGDRDTGLLADLARDRLLEALPPLDETREAGEPPLGPVRVASEEDAVAVGDERDDDRVGARVVLGAAVRAGAHVARLDAVRRVAAVRAEAMAAVPVE